MQADIKFIEECKDAPLLDRDWLYIYPKKFETGRNLASSSDWFLNTERVICRVLPDKIILVKPILDFAGKTFKVSRVKHSNKWVYFCAPRTEVAVPTGKFQFDPEESTEDQKIIYFI